MPTAPKTFRPHPPAPRDEKRWKSRNVEYRCWYNTDHWRRLRQAVFNRDCFLCQECKRNGIWKAVKEKTTRDDVANQGHADHIQPHNGDWSKFADMSNIETKCGTCHNRKTATTDHGFGR